MPDVGFNSLLNHVHAMRELCEVVSGEGHRYTFDRLGILKSSGANMWSSYGWPDGGRFANALTKDSVWVTGFLFAPIDPNGTIIGYPPLHIHHTHVTSSQSWLEHFFLLRYGKSPERMFELYGVKTIAIEFDIHGDRQCTPDHGGVKCLGHAFPPGYGTRITDPLEIFGEIIDERRAGESSIDYRVEYAFRWTHDIRRGVGRTSQPIAFRQSKHETYKLYPIDSRVFLPRDDFLMSFTSMLDLPSGDAEQLIWGEMRGAFNATMVQTWFHTHHAYTADIWLVPAAAAKLGLCSTPFYPYRISGGVEVMDLSAANTSLNEAMLHISARMKQLNEDIVCRLAQDSRFEAVDGVLYQRYRAAQCGAWSITEGKVYTLISFHRSMLKTSVVVGMHDELYGYYVTSKSSPPWDGSQLPQGGALQANLPTSCRKW